MKEEEEEGGRGRIWEEVEETEDEEEVSSATCCGAFSVMPVSVRTDVRVTDTTRPGWGM